VYVPVTKPAQLHKYTKTKLAEKRTKHITIVAKLSTGARIQYN